MPTTRRRWLLSATLLTAGLRPSNAQAPTPPPKPPTGPALPIGAVFAFTGNLSLQGDEGFRGLELATDERNASGGLLNRPIRLVRGDAADPNAAATEMRRLLDTEHIAALFAGGPSAAALAASQPAELAGIPFFELTAEADAITERGFKSLFRSCPTASATADGVMDAISDVLAVLWRVDPAAIRVSLLHEDRQGAVTTATLQERRARERGLTITDNITYAAGTADLSQAIQRLRAGRPDVVLHSGSAGDIALLYGGLAKAGWKPRMIIGSAADYALADTMQAVGPAFEGTMNVGVTQFKVNPTAAPGVADIAAAYQAKYGAPPRSGQSLATCVGARLFYAAIARADSLDHDKIRNAVLASDVAEGGTSSGWGARFDDKGQNLRARPFLMQWRNGVQLTVYPAEAAVAAPHGMLGA